MREFHERELFSVSSLLNYLSEERRSCYSDTINVGTRCYATSQIMRSESTKVGILPAWESSTSMSKASERAA